MTQSAFWLRYIVRSLLRTGRRSLFAIICIAVGVGGVVALQTASLTVQNALTSNIRAANGGDISVVSQDAPIAPGQLRVFDRLQRDGQISRWTAVASLHATAVGPQHALVPFEINVVNVPPFPLGGQPTFVTPTNSTVGALVRHHGDVLLTMVLSDELGAHVGDSLIVNSLGGTGLHVVVRGILAETSFEHAAVMTVDRRDMRSLSHGAVRYSAVYADTGANSAPVASILRRQFPLATVQTVQEALASAQAQVHDFRQFILVVGLLTLLIAGIGILNAVQSMLARRRLEIATLKTLGYGRASLQLVFGGEALVLGLVGGLVGTGLGAAGSKVISDALARALALQVPFQFDGLTLVEGIGLGMAATLIFAVYPIAQAAGVRPLELLREGGGIAPVRYVPRTVALLLVTLVLFALLAASIVGDLVVAIEFVAGAVGACAVLMGLFVLAVMWISRLGRPGNRLMGGAILLVLVALSAATPFVLPAMTPLLVVATLIWAATITPSPAHLLPLLMAVRSLSRRRARTAVTLVAFLIGVLAMSLTLTVALSLRGQINSVLAANGSANLVAVANSGTEPAVVSASRSLAGIKNRSEVVVVATTPISVNGRPASSILASVNTTSNGDPNDGPAAELGGLTGISLRAGARPASVRVIAGLGLTAADAGTDHVLARAGLRDYPWYLRIGDHVVLRDSSSGVRKTVQITGFYRRSRRGFSSFFTAPLFGDRKLALALGGADSETILSFNVAPANLTHDAATMQREVPGVLVLDIGDLTRVVETILNELLNLLAVITALALGAGLAVVANGVTLALLERRREIALLKAIGYGPGRVMQFVLVENALSGVLAGAVSVLVLMAALGLLSHFALGTPVAFDPLVAVLVLVASAALAIVTAYLAARGPVKLRSLEVLRNE